MNGGRSGGKRGDGGTCQMPPSQIRLKRGPDARYPRLMFRPLAIVLMACLACSNARANVAGAMALGGQTPESPWGVEFNPLPPHSNLYPGDWHGEALAEEIEVLADRAAGLGISWVRFSVNWSTVEARRGGEYDWSYLDASLTALRKRRIAAVLCLHGGHAAHTKAESIRGEKELQAWGDLVETMVRRYRDQVRDWEIWNEPNTIWFWKPEPNAAEYAQCVQLGSRIIRRLDPEAKVVAGSLARLDMGFAKALLDLHSARDFDALSFHPYNEMPEANLRIIKVPVHTPLQYAPADHTISELRALTGRTGLELWQAECGYPSAAGGHGWQGNGPWGEAIQAKWVLRRGLVDRACALPVSSYFALREYRLGRRLNTKGLLREGSLEPKPAYHAYRRLAALLRTRLSVAAAAPKVTRMLSQGVFSGAGKDDVLCFTFQDENQRRFSAYWLPWRMQEIIRRGEIELTLDGWKDPVLVDLLEGDVRPVSSSGAGAARLPLTDYPLLIAERSSLPEGL